MMSENIIKFKNKNASINKLNYIHAETGFFEGLYYKDNDPNVVYRIKIIFWGVNERGEVVSIIPFMNETFVLENCTNKDSFCFAGYYDVLNEQIIQSVPLFKEQEIKAYQEHVVNSDFSHERSYLQHITDFSGTHALFISPEGYQMSVVPIHSWRLTHKGKLIPFIVRNEYKHLIPVVLSEVDREDSLLGAIIDESSFNYFLSYETAQRIKKTMKDASSNTLELRERDINKK